MEQKKKIELSVEVNDVLNYALQQNGAPLLRSIVLQNVSGEELNDLVIKVRTDIDLIEPAEQVIQTIKPEEELVIHRFKIVTKGQFLATLTERITGNLYVQLCHEEESLAEECVEITALAYDEWPGLRYFPDLLAAFVTPNDPVIAELLNSVSKWLNKWTNNPSLEGYQSHDPNRVKLMAAAVYAAIQEKNITYAVPPSSFEEIGQRVRMADTVLSQHIGTCLDMTLLYVACLEAMGLNPFMVMMRGHIFAGVWLVDQNFSEPIEEDPSQLEKRMSKGIQELLVVECTMMCAGRTNSFEEARKVAKQSVGMYSDFLFAIDVLRARKSGVRPLPSRIMTEKGYVIQHEERREKDVTIAPEQLDINFEFSNEKETVTKEMQWERKLLDMSMRNMLINMRLTKAVVPLLSSFVGDLEDALVEGEEFRVLPRPLEWDMAGINTFSFETTNELGPYADLIALECKHRKLHTIYTERELNSTLLKLYRSAKTSMEENGASTLFLAMGLLRWFERKTSDVPRYAPLILIPIDITRKSASKGYVLRMRDEDPQINITLLEFLKQNYGIKINGLNPLPTDAHGLDVKKIFAIIRHGVMDEKMWDVIESGFIGNFSFSQFVMWNDVHNSREMLHKNKLVRSLIEGVVDWDCTMPEAVDTDEAYLPITADSSQIRAINMAANDVSFVLHGPPGTGKSQTITAMIANALTKGKKVLFVAEKMAALEVVQKRLASLGIGDFCLELHSNKAVKKSVLSQLKRGLESSGCNFDTQYDEKIKDIREMRANLDAYAQKLHERRRFGKSLRELIDLYEIVPDRGHELRFATGFARNLMANDLDDQKHLLERLVAAGQAIGHPCEHPLAEVQQTVYSQSLKLDLENTIADYQKALTEYQVAVCDFIELLELSVPVTEKEWRKNSAHAISIMETKDVPDFLLKAESIELEFRDAYSYLQRKISQNQKKEAFLSKWNENFLRMDMNEFQRKYEEAGKKLFGKGKALAAITSEIQSYASFNVVAEQIPALLTDVSFYQKDVAEVDVMKDKLSVFWQHTVEKYESIEALKKYEDQLKYQILLVKPYSDKIQMLKAMGQYEKCLALCEVVFKSYEKMCEAEAAVNELLNVKFAQSEGNWLEGRKQSCNRIRDNSSRIKDWIVYRQFAKECNEAGLGVVCEAYEKGMPHEEVIDVYMRSIYKAIALSVIEEEPVLNSFTGIGFNERILQFKKLDEEFMELTKEEVLYKLTQNLPTGRESVIVNKELNILRRAISSNGRGMSIRTLFDQIPTILTMLCPCMLMSPISVAQYLVPENDLFDIVIFDEASQLPTCKAVGVLARGKNAVIVGDPNQMPPTSFFAGNTVDEDNLDIEDLESILDDCLALGMPQTHLSWHYRSRHESLIAFSNHEFYENSMLTFPSVNDQEKRVQYRLVEGYFDRGKGRVNTGEAKAIVEEIRRRYKDPDLKEKSVGVVTFNINQQILIEDMLQAEYQKNVDFDKWANAGEEPLFVKNLENVQGDERDVILFSIAYGPDADGKFSMNFGPINKEGGWKRLNVAVTRARSEMIVFSIMSSHMIDLKRTRSKGVEALKNFMEFAEKGKIVGKSENIREQKNQGILETICKELENVGYKYVKDVGRSDFKIDIAVVNPFNTGEYLLGIMLDRASYKQSKNTKDREVAQKNVLQSLGWRLHRIWAMDWWDNKEKELSQLMDILKIQKEEAALRAPEVQTVMEPLVLEETVVKEESVIEDAPVEDEAVTEVQTVGKEVTVTEAPRIAEELAVLEESVAVQKVKIACIQEEKIAGITVEGPVTNEYVSVEYISAEVPVTPMDTATYVSKQAAKQITEKAQMILDVEAPIMMERLIKKTLRGFGIQRSTAATLEATEKALKKVPYKGIKQNGVKFYWNPEELPESYMKYRVDVRVEDKRLPEEISQQELKNAICITLQRKGALDKDDLIKETVRTMGYARSGKALVEAVERGLKYGRKTGEIIQNEEKKFSMK